MRPGLLSSLIYRTDVGDGCGSEFRVSSYGVDADKFDLYGAKVLKSLFRGNYILIL